MRKLSILLALVASLIAMPAYADFTGKDASAATITFKNPGTCTSVVCVPVFQIYDGTNVVALTTAGADVVSNTLTGVPVYGRTLVFNGTTWDRWQGAVTVAGVATAANQTTINTSIGTTNTDLGPPGTTTCATDTGSCAINALMQRIAQNLTTLNTTAGTATPACAAAPCVTTIGNVGEMANVGGTDTKSIKCGSSIVYDASTNGSTQLVALSGATSVYVCGYTIMAGGTVNVKLITGTGAACVTGTASITPAFQLTAQAGVADGANEYRGLKGAASSELCINTSAGVAVQAIVYYTQF